MQLQSILRVLIEYVNALRKKFQRRKRVPNLTAATESNLSFANRGHKQNEVQKKARKQAAKSRQESLSANLHVNKRDQYPTATPSHLQRPLNKATTQRETFTPLFGPISYTHEFPIYHQRQSLPFKIPKPNPFYQRVLLLAHHLLEM